MHFTSFVVQEIDSKGTYTAGIDNFDGRSIEGKEYGTDGIAHPYMGVLDTIIGNLERFAIIAKELGLTLVEGVAYDILGCTHLNLGNSKSAIDYYERYLKIAKELGDRSREGKAYGFLGNAYNSLGGYKTAIRYHERYLNIATGLGDKLGEGRAYGCLGTAQLGLGYFKRAKDYSERHLKIAREVGDRSGEGLAYEILGNAHSMLGHFKTALDYHERALEIAKKLGKKSAEGGAYGNIGVIHRILGDIKKAIDYHKRHLLFAKETGDKSGMGLAYLRLGNAHLSLGDFKTTIDYYKRNLKIVHELGDISGEGTAYCNLGTAYYSLGDYKTAKDYHERHLKIARKLGERFGEGTAYGNLGCAHNRLGELKTAIDYHELQLKFAKELGDTLGQGLAYCNLGDDHGHLGDFETALVHYERHLKIAKELGDRWGEGTANGNLGVTYLTLGDVKAAISHNERHLKIALELGDRSGEGKAYGNLGNAYTILGETRTAIYHNERKLKIAKELGERSEEGRAYENLGNAHSMMLEFTSAIEYYKRSLEVYMELDDLRGKATSCSLLGMCFKSLDQASEAIRYYKLSVTFLDKMRDSLQIRDEWKISFRDQYQTTYASLWRLILAEGKVTEALFSAEQGRAQALKDLIEFNYAFEKSNVPSGTDNGTVNEMLSYLPPNTLFAAFGEKELIFWVCQRGEKVELRKKQIHSQHKVSSFFQALCSVAQQEIGTRNLLKCEDRSLELASNKSLVTKRSPQDERKAQHLDLTKDALSTLYEIIIEPIQDLLLGKELIFVPEGPLCLAPFAAFKGPDSKYLSESFKIRLAPSLTSLKMIAACPLDYHHKTGALLVGDPLKELSPLPCARKEVEMLGRMLGVTPLIGEQATKDEVLRQLSSVALVHIAAHGNMEKGEIALASTEVLTENILTMRDVLGVQMRARLVVLSCCHSARGEIKAEGVVGIARAFLGAGARSVLVSLWAIDDKATLEFMKNFYQHLVKGISASESLNQTMNCMRESKDFNAVKYWAPFVLIGDDVTLEFAGNE